jgi:hypothetical protein
MQKFIRRSQLLTYGWWLLLSKRWEVWQIERRLASQRGRLAKDMVRLEKAWENWEYMRTPEKRERVRIDLREVEIEMAALTQKICDYEMLLANYHRTIHDMWQKIRAMV